MSPRMDIRSRLLDFMRRREALVPIISLLIVAVSLLVGYIVVPPTPDTVVLSSGIEGGAYAAFSEKYRKILAREKVRLKELPSSGSVDNLKRLSDSTFRVDIGFVQDGTGSSTKGRNLVSLGAICYSPLWVFCRNSEVLDDLSKLKGKKIAIGVEGSGVRKLAIELLRASDAAEPPTELFDLQGAAANKALMEGTVDVVMVIGTEDNTLVKELLYTSSVRLLNFRRAEAYTRLFPALSHVVLPAGILNLSRSLPAEDVHLLATTTSLIAREGLHPALIYLLLDAAIETHGNAGWVNRRREFPSSRELDFPSSKYAERFYKSGRPFLFDYLPLRVAVLVDRLVVIMVPLAFLFGPLMYSVSSLYAWGNRRKLYRWYRRLKELEMEIKGNIGLQEARKFQERLDRIETSINNIHVPLPFFPDVYRLKEDLEFVRGRLERLSVSDGKTQTKET